MNLRQHSPKRKIEDPTFVLRSSFSDLRSVAGFTMMEIAIALGVIAFALVAIMGVLPTGMQVERDNRQDTIVNNDGTYLLEAIRNGAENIPDLANFCDEVNGQQGLSSYQIITNLCTPFRTNSAVFRSITGPAALRGTNVPSFRYVVRSEINRLNNINPDLGTNVFGTNALIIADNSYEVRLVFLWPVLPNNQLADAVQKQVFRTTITGVYDLTNAVFNLTEFIP